MSDSQAYEAITVASDGVSVTKRFEADEFPVPAIAFQFESTRNEPVSVRLTDVVPEDVAVEDLGFHPEYGSEYWTIDDDRITFERELEAEAEYTTVYGIRATGTDNVEQFLTEPTLEQVDPPLEDDEEALVGEGSDAVKDVIAGESDEVPGLEEEDEDVATLELNDPDSEAEGAAPEDGAADADDLVGDSDSLVSAIVREVRNDEVTADDLKLLRRALDIASDRGSTRARLEKLQGDVDEVLAYSEALESFLDENGTGADAVEEFQEEVDSFRDELEAIRGDVDSVEGDLSSVESELDEVHQTAAATEDELASVSGTVEQFESRLEELESEVESIKETAPENEVEDRIEEIDDEIEELKAWREQLSSVIGGN